MGGRKGESDLNRSRETVPLEGERLPKDGRPFALVLQRQAWAGDERTPLCAWRGSEQSPTGGRTFASSVSTTLWRGLMRTIAQGWANVCFLSKFGTLEETSGNDCPRVGERSLPQ
jgi:hypothetical protein